MDATFRPGPAPFDPRLEASVDPRFEARRQAVEIDEARRRRLRRLTVVSLLATVVLAIGATRTPLFDVDRIVVAGAVATPAAEVAAAAEVAHGDLLVDVDGRRAAEGVESLPWVEAARVSARWPGSVVIEVAERQAAGLVTDGDVSLVVDDQGRVLEHREGRAEGAIEVEGLPAVAPGEVVPDTLRAALEVADLLPERVRERTRSVALADGELRLTLDPMGEVRLGDGRSLAQKVLALDTLLLRVDDTCLATVDVRVPDAPVLTRDASCETVSSETRG